MKDDKEFLDSLLQDYFAECDEHLLSIKKNLIALEDYLDKEVINEEIINELFRSFHTIKGLSAMVGILQAEKLSHQLESYLKLLRTGKKSFKEEDLLLLRDGVKLLEEVILCKKENKEIPDIEEALSKLKVLTTHDETPKEFKEEVEKKKEERVYKIVFYPSQELSEKGINVEFLRKNLQEKTKLLKAIPQVDKDKKIYFEFLFSCDDESNLEFLKELNIQYYPEEEKGRLEEKVKSVPTTLSPTTFIRVDLSKLDELMRIVGELVITKSRLQEDFKEIESVVSPIMQSRLSETIRLLDKNLRNLRESLMKVRLVPIGEAFERMQFVIRDLIRESKKKINLHILGKETELDKYIVERLIDPLLHLVRNAVSHGIEEEKDRLEKGKDPYGNIYLRAYTSGDNVIIEVEDDGKGIDRDKIADKALELGMIRGRDELNSDEKVLEIICSPDFSTRDSADRESGRGVGMSVVKNTIQELGGNLYLSSEKDKGTRFILKLPLTLAILDSVLVEVGKERYAIPQSYIKEIIEVKNEDIVRFKGIKMIPYRAKSIPVLFISEIFNLPTEKKEKYHLLIVTKENQDIGIGVDKVISVKEAVVRPITDPIILKNPAIMGGTDFGDGKVVLILNIDGLLKGRSEKSVLHH
uniref:Chemotaxis protein CheA n=1 Tax=Dictyoglomus thermophilum TaxID=14 RepID=A0A7C3RV71_DICTH